MKNSNEYDPSIEIQLSAPTDHLLIQSDEAQIKQMIWNLCINGIQAMDNEGRLSLEISSIKGFKHGEFNTRRRGVLLIIQDEGKGIPPDRMQQVFEPFFTTRDEGVGLGLPTVAQIVKRFGGYIGVDSAIGKGTRFNVFLPQERSLQKDSSESQDEPLVLSETESSNL